MALPELFGSYLLHHQLARGVTSDVFLARTIGEFPRVCTVRRLRPEFTGQQNIRERFREDAELLVRLLHGNLVQVLEVGAVEEQLFIAMEQIDGIDYAELVTDVPQKGPLPAEMALFVGIEMCEALAYLHPRRVEQAGGSLDVTRAWPLELMISFDGVVKLIDLGSFSALHLGKQKVSQLMRCPGFVAPEILHKQAIDQRTDVYAVGVVLWELLSGRRLITSDPEGYVGQVVKGTWQAPLVERQDVPGDVIRLVGEMLATDPQKRPQTIDAVRGKLVSHLRRMAPAYGSSNLSRLVMKRCGSLIGELDRLTDELLHRAQTEHSTRVAAHTQSYGSPKTIDREIGKPVKLAPGDEIPGTRYRMVRRLGRGGSAEVIAAQHIDLDRQVAIKILSPDLAKRSHSIAQFRLEARACSRIGHPNIIEVIDFGELNDGRFFFAMELLEGRSLAQVLGREHHLEPARILGIFRQITRAVQAAHEQAIIHRDLKPENIMLVEREGRPDFVKVLDFGVMAFAEDGGEQRVVGTPGYMAPEQIVADSPTVQMDVYALGATLYECLCGKTPFPGKSLEAYIQGQTRGQPTPIREQPGAENVPAPFERMLTRALDPDPEQRHRSMLEFQSDLDWVQSETGLASGWDDLSQPRKPSGSTPEMRRPSRAAVVPQGGPSDKRSPFWMIALIALAGIGGVYAWYQSRPTKAKPQVTVTPPSRPPNQPPAKPPAAKPAKKVDPVAPLLARIRKAADRGDLTHPKGTSAYDLLIGAELAHADEPRLAQLRKELAGRLSKLAALLAQKRATQTAARTLYRQALLFTPDDGLLKQTLAGLRPAGKPAPKPSARPEARAAQVAWLVAQVRQAVADGRYLKPPKNNALAYLVKLRKLDPTGKLSRQAQDEMAQLLMREAQRLQSAGKVQESKTITDALGDLKKPVAVVPGNPATKAAKVQPIKNNAQRAAELLKQARSAFSAARYTQARGFYQKALAADINNAAAAYGLARVSFAQAQYSKAVLQSKRALKKNRKLIDAHILLGDAYYKLLRRDDARDAWQRGLNISPQNKRIKGRLARLSQ